MQFVDLSGVWQCAIPGQTAPMAVPGTLDESGIGHPDRNANQWHPDAQANAAMADSGVIATRLTRRYTYEGPARISGTFDFVPLAGKRIFVEVERARCLSLAVNGQSVPDFAPPTISTPHVFEATGLLTEGKNTLTFTADNSYPGLPHDAIVYSSAATDETQTNWNGLLGYVRLRIEDAAFIQAVRVYPRGDTLDVQLEVCAPDTWRGKLTIESECLRAPAVVDAACGLVTAAGLALRPDTRRWDEDEGVLYSLTAGGDLSPVTVAFGVRDFTARDGGFALNGRRIFLRGEANCAEFPETGYPPMTAEAWMKILDTYRGYGVNCLRFHSHIPPEAAFAAADRMGMLMQPELSHWNPRDAFEDGASYAYYFRELRESVKWLCNHPSFVMMTFGNELAAGDLGHARMAELLNAARGLDGTRLYACASNPHYGNQGPDPHSDFYTSQSCGDQMIRATCANMTGYLNHAYPSARADYSAGLSAVRERYAGPVFSFEVGQYEVLPDFDELRDFHGVTSPDNLSLIQRRVKERGLEADWKRRVEASGELSNLCYREEIEAALRTDGLSGISLLGLQDFPGQGTALVGMLNSHLTPKPFPFAAPERFRAFFDGVRPLALLPRYTWEEGETLDVRVRFANYGKTALGGSLAWTLTDGAAALRGGGTPVCAAQGGLTDVGTISAPLNGFAVPARLTLTVAFGGKRADYPLWLYPKVKPVCPECVHETAVLDDAALAVLTAGGIVYLTPPSTEEALPASVQAQFSTDFWSVGTFSGQSGAMGQLIAADHPIFARFPTSFHTDWQWWPMAVQRALVLPQRLDAIITELDSYAFLRPMAQLLECRCCGGRLLVSSLGLQNLQQYPEARALLDSIYAYLSSDAFAPAQEIPPELIRSLVK